MIYYVSATDEGCKKVASYTGENSEINLLEASILAIAHDGISFHDLGMAIRESYPSQIGLDSLGERCRSLQRNKLLNVIDEVNEGTSVNISFEAPGGKAIETLQNLGVFLSRNHQFDRKAIIESLQWDGNYTNTYEGITYNVYLG